MSANDSGAGGQTGAARVRGRLRGRILAVHAATPSAVPAIIALTLLGAAAVADAILDDHDGEPEPGALRRRLRVVRSGLVRMPPGLRRSVQLHRRAAALDDAAASEQLHREGDGALWERA